MLRHFDAQSQIAGKSVWFSAFIENRVPGMYREPTFAEQLRTDRLRPRTPIHHFPYARTRRGKGKIDDIRQKCDVSLVFPGIAVK